MGNFTKAFTKKYEFDGDSIMVTMTRLKRSDAMSIAPYMKKDDRDETKMAFADSMAFMNAAADFLPPHIKTINGLIIDGNVPLNIDNKEDADIFYSDMYFFPLLSRIANDLMKESFATSNQVNDVKKPVTNTSKDLPDTQDL